ncbi:MAG: carbohydrate kinase family protein [Chloroflexota bacterium]|nr:carbohydrate kinase family protein [Chloroflexota bacterium]
MSSGEIKFDVLCYGTISADNLIYVPYLPNPRRDSHVQQEMRRLGGEALVVAEVLSRWGLRVAVVGNAIGKDFWGHFIVDQLAAFPGVDTRYLVQRADVQTPFCRILVTPDGERSILGYWFDEAPKSSLTEEMMKKARLLSVDVYGKAERDQAAMIARRLGRPVVSADAIWPDYPLAGLSDLIVISRDFLNRYFPGVYTYDHVLDLQRAGAGEIVVTQGKNPVLAVDCDSRPHTVEPYHVRTVDTTGAGDVFKAAEIYGRLQDWDLIKATQFSCAAASLFISAPRGGDRTPDLRQVIELAEI